jgi:hypothetical protein
VSEEGPQLSQPLRHPNREWLDFVSDLFSAPLTRWPDEQVTRMLVGMFDALAGAFHCRVGAGSLEQRQWPPELFRVPRALPPFHE